MRPLAAQIPNVLTVLRLLSVPVVAWLLYHQRFTTALGLVFVSGLTDAVDGAVARRMGWQSRFGQAIDPIADKALLTTLYLMMALAGVLPVWLAGLVVARDVVILAGVAVVAARTGQREFPPSAWGKASTIAQIVTSVTALSSVVPSLPVGLSGAAQAALPVCVAATALLAVVSGGFYVWQGIRLLRDTGAIDAP